MKLYLIVLLSLCVQINGMNPESMMHHSEEEKKPNPLEPLMQLRTVEAFEEALKKSDITRWNMVNPNDGNTILHYWARCNSWHPGLGPRFSTQIDVNTQNKEGKTSLQLLIENSPCYDTEGIENLAKKFSYLMQAGALLEGRRVMDDYGKTPIKTINEMMTTIKDPVVEKIYALIYAELIKTRQHHLLVKIPQKAAL